MIRQRTIETKWYKNLHIRPQIQRNVPVLATDVGVLISSYRVTTLAKKNREESTLRQLCKNLLFKRYFFDDVKFLFYKAFANFVLDRYCFN